jgi:hypothetical protein
LRPAEIRRLLIRDGLVDDVKRQTVARWVSPAREKQWRVEVEHALAARASRSGTSPLGQAKARPEYKLARAGRLKQLGLSSSDVAVVMAFDFRQPVTRHQVDWALKRARWPKPLKPGDQRRTPGREAVPESTFPRRRRSTP